MARSLTHAQRRSLREALRAAAPWLEHPDHGPSVVDAGTCERCGDAPRLLPTCGPSGAQALCRDCAVTLGDQAWCDGHRDEGRAARRWAGQLPPRWADAVVLWWVATGELRDADLRWPAAPGAPHDVGSRDAPLPAPSSPDPGELDRVLDRALGRARGRAIEGGTDEPTDGTSHGTSHGTSGETSHGTSGETTAGPPTARAEHHGDVRS